MNEPIKRFSDFVIEEIRSVPPGKVASYGQIARLAGNPRGARQVARILHTCSKKHDLPWHRIINSQGRISLPGEQGHEQRRLLEAEGVIFKKNTVSLKEFQWEG